MIRACTFLAKVELMCSKASWKQRKVFGSNRFYNYYIIIDILFETVLSSVVITTTVFFKKQLANSRILSLELMLTRI